MAKDLQKELDKKRFALVRYGLLLVLSTIGLVLLSLIFIEIEGRSILSSVLAYYFR
ncbi:MAG: hypothetical protein V6Z82_03815 [Flavobacteriales bacterium]